MFCGETCLDQYLQKGSGKKSQVAISEDKVILGSQIQNCEGRATERLHKTECGGIRMADEI